MRCFDLAIQTELFFYIIRINNVFKTQSYISIFLCILGVHIVELEGSCAFRYLYYYTRSFTMYKLNELIVAVFHHIFFYHYFSSKSAKKANDNTIKYNTKITKNVVYWIRLLSFIS